METIKSIMEALLPNEAVWFPWAHYYASLPLFPFFSTVHFILTAFALRSERGSLHFTFNHPIASCAMTFIVASSGNILANLLLAKPLLDCALNGWAVVVCILCWYLIYFSPFDVFYYLCAATPVQLILHTIEEFARAKKVLSGVVMAMALYPNSMVAMAIVGMFKGSGKRWGVTWYRLIYQSQGAGMHELLSISFITKASFTLGLLFAYNHSRETTLVDDAHLLVLGALVLTLIKCWTLLLRSTDPFALPQSLTWRMATVLSFPPPNRPDIEKEHIPREGEHKVEKHLKKD